VLSRTSAGAGAAASSLPPDISIARIQFLKHRWNYRTLSRQKTKLAFSWIRVPDEHAAIMHLETSSVPLQLIIY
jgi:hypothetical protein